MSFKSKVSTAFNWTKSCFNSSAWYDAAKDHAQKAAPLIDNASKGIVMANFTILGSALYGSQKAQNAVKKPSTLAKEYIGKPIQEWGDDKVKCDSKVTTETTKQSQTSSTNQITNTQRHKDTKTWKAVNALGQVAEKGVAVAGGAVVLAGLYAASNGATKIGKAIFWDRSKSAIKEAATESLEDANAIRHGFQAVGDYAIGGIVNIAEGAWNQTLGRVFNRHDDEHATDIAGNITDALDSEA